VARIWTHEPGWARIALWADRFDGGIEDMRRGLSMYDASGARLWRPHYLGLLAHALAGANHIDEAFREVASALAMVKVTGEYWCAAELHRIEGELLIMQAAGDEQPSTPPRKLPSSAAARAEGCFRQALAIARQQQARSWELRVSTSLGRLLHRQDKQLEAHRVVQEALDWFKEGHDTEDQKAPGLVNAWHAPRSRISGPSAQRDSFAKSSDAPCRRDKTSPRHDRHVMTRGLDARYSGPA
jgi:predicted ATPase